MCLVENFTINGSLFLKIRPNFSSVYYIKYECISIPLGGPLCSCCVSDPLALSFLPPYNCQSHRTASVAALRMKAREHSEAVLQSAQLISPQVNGNSTTSSTEDEPERSTQVQEQNDTEKNA